LNPTAYVAPLLFFSQTLYRTRQNGIDAYGTLGYRLSNTFFDKWVHGRSVDVGVQLLASTDPSTVADYELLQHMADSLV
jgi:hypothetical protein